MIATILAMVLILSLVAGVGGLVLMGIEGRWRQRAPRLADRFARAAQHLNGDGQPPRTLTRSHS